MKLFTVITSINEPTKGVIKNRDLNKNLIVVGDKKSPSLYLSKGFTYFSYESQKKLNYTILGSLPDNHYSRKMLGYLYAIQNKAEIIYDTDDDNIPNKNWYIPHFNGKFNTLTDNLGNVNVYSLFSDQKIWPRGLPLNLINSNHNLEGFLSLENSQIAVWQGLANGDPDVDAIYRLTYNSPCFFKDRDPIVLGKGTISPFNSQNTFFHSDFFELLYLPTTVTFRYTDILRALVALPIVWLYNYRVGFISATVDQFRNDHDLYMDFLSEIPMYTSSHKIIDLVSEVIDKRYSIAENLIKAYQALESQKIVQSKEIIVLKSWLFDITAIRQGK